MARSNQGGLILPVGECHDPARPAYRQAGAGARGRSTIWGGWLMAKKCELKTEMLDARDDSIIGDVPKDIETAGHQGACSVNAVFFTVYWNRR
jgi:hypothetical protein